MACLIDPAEYEVVTINVPEDLVDVPTPGRDEDHQAWVDTELERRTVRA
ncbi:hypothetical protein [Streptomyces sp. NPDC060022]